MAEEPKDLPQGESMAASDTTTDSTHVSELKDAGSTEQEEAAVAPATSGAKSIEPQDETFWEESVDASAVNLADAGTAQEKKEEERAVEDTSESGNAPPGVNEENTTGEEIKEATSDETQAEEQSVSAASETSGEDSAPADEETDVAGEEENTTGEEMKEATSDETQAEEQSMSAASKTSGEDSVPADEETDQPAPEDESPPVMDSNKEIATEKKEEGATEAAPETGDTPAEDPPADESSGQVKAEEITVENKEGDEEEIAAVTGKEAQAESEITVEAEKKEGEEDNREVIAEKPEDPESPPQEKTEEQSASEVKEPEIKKEDGQQKEEEVSAADAPEAEGEVIKSSWRPSRRATMIAAGIALLIIGSVGFSVVLDLPSGNRVTSTFLGKHPENAYDMKFFLPLDVGYEEARFVKVTIAIELMDKGFKREIDKNVAKLRQEVIDLLLTKSPQEVKSSKGKKLLREEITSRLNHHFAKDCIKDTYFTELVIL